MYTSSTASREKALLAAAAAERAMKRYECCKSQFKFKCFACGEMINRGDKITHCNRAPTGMTLRYRGADSQNGLTVAEVTFYQAYTGNNMWVHVGCIPCYWDSLPEHCNKHSRPRLRPICTDWGVKVYGEWEEWRTWEGEAWQHMDVPYFCRVKGYPKEKFMRDRIIHAVKRFQAIWRGYIYKKAYPIARREARATEAINLNARATLSTKTAGDRAVDYALAEQKFLRENSPGDCGAILFDRNRKTEALYSYEILSLPYEANGLVVYVEFHHDGDRRKYNWKKFLHLREECCQFMRQIGICCTFKGIIRTHHRHRFT